MDQPTRTTVEPMLLELARNHRWTWDAPTAALLASIPGAAADVHPAATVLDLDDDGWAAILADAPLLETLDACHADLRALLADTPDADIAYVSAEFGISELVPQYSGGLGVLAGDHLKSASDLGLPLAGIGLFYRQGFFRQELEGNQQAERYETLSPERLGYVDTGVTVAVDIGEDRVQVRVWRLAVGRVDLFALDTDVAANRAEHRTITDRL